MSIFSRRDPSPQKIKSFQQKKSLFLFHIHLYTLFSLSFNKGQLASQVGCFFCGLQRNAECRLVCYIFISVEQVSQGILSVRQTSSDFFKIKVLIRIRNKFFSSIDFDRNVSWTLYIIYTSLVSKKREKKKQRLETKHEFTIIGPFLGNSRNDTERFSLVV